MLTEIRIRNLKPRERPYPVADSHGLYVEVFPNGSKLWRIRHVMNGKEKRKSLGPWPLVSLKEAREINDRRRYEKATGKELEKPRMTVSEICAKWREKFMSVRAPVTRRKLAILFDKHISPAIGALDVGSLTAEIVMRDLLSPIEDAGHFETAHRVKSTLSRVLRFAMGLGIVDKDATMPLTGLLTPVKVRHMPTITDAKRAGRLLLDIGNYSGSPVVTYALKMLPYVFVRTGELRHAEWKDIDFANAVWTIPAERMKTRSSHIVPLSNQVLELLRGLKEYTGDGKYLFPGRNLKTKPMSDMAINAALRYLGYERDVICGHGFRAMASTLLNGLGYNSDWIERQLAHAPGGVRAAYNHADWLPERRKMMQDWADYLDKLASEAGSA